MIQGCVSATVGILGDVMLGREVAAALRRVAPEEVWSAELRGIAASCDAVICNLECCISERGRPTDRVRGKPFFFRAPPAAVASLRAMAVSAAGLANNHALDYETEALADTVEALDGAGIVPVGAGRGEEEARRGAVVAAADTRLGLVAFGDHPAEFAASPGKWGVAFADVAGGCPGSLLDEVARLGEECDAVVAFPHWGPNMTVQPAPWQRRAAAELQAAGADLVAGHSAHVFHGVEWTAAGPILSDLGDALDDYAVNRRLRNDLGLMALWRPGPPAELELVGLRLDFCRTELAEGEEAEWIARRLERACGELGTNVERISEQRFRVSPE